MIGIIDELRESVVRSRTAGGRVGTLRHLPGKGVPGVYRRAYSTVAKERPLVLMAAHILDRVRGRGWRS